MEKKGKRKVGAPSKGDLAKTHKLSAAFTGPEADIIRQLAESRRETPGSVLRRLVIGELVLPAGD